MNRDRLFEYLKKQGIDTLIKLLQDCYDIMSTQKIRDVFGHVENEWLKEPAVSLDGEKTLEAVRKFQEESLVGKYYAPFNINSKNYMSVPEETEVWFEKVGDLITDSSQLSSQNDHVHAVQCFRILYELIDQMELDDNIVFADEYGRWMIVTDEEVCIEAYIKSAAMMLSPEEYVETVLPFIIRDSRKSFSNKKVYSKVRLYANKQQQTLLDKEIAEQKIAINCKKKK